MISPDPGFIFGVDLYCMVHYISWRFSFYHKNYLTNKFSKLSIKLEPISTNLGLSGMAPEIYADTPEVEADEGYFVTLSCSAGGSPRPTIFWTRGGSTVSLLFDN